MIGELRNKGTNQMTNQGETGPPGDIRPALPPRHGQPPNALSIFYVFGSNTTAIGGQVKLYV